VLWHHALMPRLRQNVMLDGRPVRTLARGVLWLAHCVGRVPATVAIEEGGPYMRLEPYLRNFGSTSIFMKRSGYEPELLLLSGLINRGDVVIDIGANFGIYSLMAAKRTGAVGKVYSFEPGAEALRQLERNCALNPGLKIHIVPIGLSDANGTRRLFHIGGPTTFSVGGSDTTISEAVQLVTLDSWVASIQLKQIDLIKVDVEGHEPQVFRGGTQSLASFKPLILFEVSASALQRNGSSVGAAYEALTNIGYEMFRLEGQRLVAIGRAEEGNFFAVHKESQWPQRLYTRGIL
jgi:FkbM family methyltransferase